MRIPISAAALAVGGSLALAGLTMPAAHAVGTDQECRSLGIANGYGEFIEGDDTHTPDAEGAVAVGGNADFTGGFSVGQELTAAELDALPGKNALVVAGKITGHNTQVMKGNGVYGAKADAAVVQAHAGGIAQGASPIDFKAEFAKLRAASTSLAAVPQTAGATVQTEGTKLTFSGGDAKYNSFTVDAAKLQGAKDVFVKVPAGSVTVINVTGGTYDMAAAGTTGFHLWDAGKSAFVLDDKLQSAASGAIRAKLLWNFPTATKVVKNSQAAWAGTVLAPNAAFDLGSGGPVNGSVIAASLTGKGGAETHHYPFTGCLPGTVVPTPSVTPPVVVPPVGPSGTPTVPATATPGTSASPSGTPSVPATGKPGTSASPSPSASSSAVAAAATAAPSGSASPSAQANAGGNLAHTGSGPVVPLAIGGAVVIAAGAGIVVAARRKAARKA
ncbi:choice-of-anchor A family protein [Kitasatospora sp. SUK 42]|uniref:choice-of-anchor A family protein n=1 Tax=Kitasatospora sp. SUK 42 TaxID=1588882 RepID=UPI0018C9F0B9|nr:choice-of-anchor A family protein [Kitasatospora sp. SUK 42]MBV2151456.1 choice-of-anchor A family protein [Kitasatospora sp. SUK 42]